MDVHVWANDLIWDDLGHYLMLEELFERPDSEFYDRPFDFQRLEEDIATRSRC